MTSKASNGSDVFIEALRQNTPRDEDRERMRAALLAAGVAVGASTVAATGGAAAQMTGVAQHTGVTVWGKLSLLPVAVKTGICITALAVGAGVGVGAQRMLVSSVVAPNAARVAGVISTQQLVPSAAVLVAVVTKSQPDELAVRAPRSETARQPRRQRARVATPVTPTLVASAPEQPPTAAGSAAPSSLADEAALLEQGLRALARGQTANAHKYLDLHRQRYPHGALHIERQRAEQQLRATNPEHPDTGASHE